MYKSEDASYSYDVLPNYAIILPESSSPSNQCGDLKKCRFLIPRYRIQYEIRLRTDGDSLQRVTSLPRLMLLGTTNELRALLAYRGPPSLS